MPPQKNDHPLTAQWEHGKGLKLGTNTGAIEEIFDIPSSTQGIKKQVPAETTMRPGGRLVVSEEEGEEEERRWSW